MAGRRRIHPVVVQTLTGKCSRQGSALAVACRTRVLKLRKPKEGWATGIADKQRSASRTSTVIAVQVYSDIRTGYHCTGVRLLTSFQTALFLKGQLFAVPLVEPGGNVVGLLALGAGLGLA